MTTDSDLASWNEPPATSSEVDFGIFIDKVLDNLGRGKSVNPESMPGIRVEQLESSKDLVRAASLLVECAASVWEKSIVLPAADANDPDQYPTLRPSMFIPRQPCHEEDEARISPEAKVGNMPNPFPGEFRIQRLLGEGQFGKVWLADDLHLGWQVAIKTLKLPATSTLGPIVLATLQQEGKHLAQLNHPNIVRVHSWREVRGEYFLIMQYISGGSLADRLKKKGALEWQDAARYIADVGEALVEAHKRGVVHRDVKDDNILWDAERDEALLTDFGVSTHFTEPGSVAGTPMFMAPEAFDGKLSPSLDVYSLAATLFRLITGKMPFPANSMQDLLNMKRDGLPDPDARCQCMPEQLERIIRTGLAGQPEFRPTLSDFISSLRGSLNQLLADDLATPASEAGSKAPVNLQLVVSRRVQGDTYAPAARTKPTSTGLSRDMKKVPRPPEQISLRTGDRVRIEVITDKTGYMTVFNIGPTGNLNLLYPDNPTATPSPVEANRPLHVVDVEMTPPVGRERVFAVWSREPLPLRLEQLLSIVDRSSAVASRPYQSTRDMKRVQHSIDAMASEARNTAILELDHTSR